MGSAGWGLTPRGPPHPPPRKKRRSETGACLGWSGLAGWQHSAESTAGRETARHRSKRLMTICCVAARLL
eukprot:15466175-Alexandrium_andersonii.AAC.1